jgi:hypothetical protein
MGSFVDAVVKREGDDSSHAAMTSNDATPISATANSGFRAARRPVDTISFSACAA